LNFERANRRVKIKNIHDQLEAEIADQEIVDKEYVWQEMDLPIARKGGFNV
jgi:hypothetical protein